MTTTNTQSKVILQIIKGDPRGSFVLPVDQATRIGRDTDCDIVLDDLRCSRVHAIVTYDESDGTWWLHDQNSSNGTYVNGSKIEETQLGFGADIRIGSIEFRFLLMEDTPSDDITETIVMGHPVVEATSVASSNLEVLNQLALRLLRCVTPDEAVEAGLDVLMRFTEATVVGFLLSNDNGDLRVHTMFPAESDEFRLSDMLTEHVLSKQHAVWVQGQTAHGNSGSLSHYADAICVPLVSNNEVLAAIHLYTKHSNFSEEQFNFAIAVGNTMVAAVVNTRRQARLQVEHQRMVAKSAASDDLIGESQPMKVLKTTIAKIAKASGCVLVRGESGAGKELVARAIHRQGARADRPMLSVNCAAIPRDLMESQLFGHKKGAFTGAEQNHDGWFKQADSGTLFLDEVGEMTLEGQAKLLRILEGHPFLPVGGVQEVTVDVRVIAATNRDLREFVREGKFREDLYYRLSVFELVIPPLRERGDDVGLLIDFFLEHFRIQHGRPSLVLSPKSREKLMNYSWPGNVRQLRNVIDSAVVMSDATQIQPDDLGLREAVNIEQESLNIEHWERKLIKEALRRTGNHVPEAAKLLGIGRATLYRKVEEYGIDR